MVAAVFDVWDGSGYREKFHRGLEVIPRVGDEVLITGTVLYVEKIRWIVSVEDDSVCVVIKVGRGGR